MAKIKSFRGLRPTKDLAEKVSELPYDVVSCEEAKEIAGNNTYSFFHITRPEIGLSCDMDPYDDVVYKTGKKNLDFFIEHGILKQDDDAKLYLYTQVMDGRPQTGLVACVSIDDYINNNVKKHELTREDKEKDRTKHLNILNANTGPVFLLYREDGSRQSIFKKAMQLEPEYDFVADDGIRHIVRVIDDNSMINDIEKSFKDDTLYIADGHHRAASGVRVGQNRREDNPGFTGEEEYNGFLAVIFPHDQLKILAYNRVVKDLNGMNTGQFLEILKKNFSVEKTGKMNPEGIREFSMYLDGNWYTLQPQFEISKDPIESLDVRILQDNLLNPVLGIKDPRTEKRINFIGGIRGTAELEKLVDSGEYKVAFSMFPTSVEQLMDVSDSDGIMPPKSTWFEPKLRSGLFVHLL